MIGFNSLAKEISHHSLGRHISPLRYGYVFMLGYVCYYIRYKLDYNKKYIYELLTIIGIASLIYYMCNDNGSLFHYSIITSIIIVSGHKNNQITRLLFENKLILMLGTISYSLYLLHMIIIGILPQYQHVVYQYIYCLISILLSILSYKYIEIPFIKLNSYRLNK